MKLNGKDAAIAAARGTGTIEQISRRVVYTRDGRQFIWGCRTVAEATETLAVFQELARRQIERETMP